MISRKPCKVSHKELSRDRNLMADRTSGLSKENIVAPHRIARYGLPSGPALQETYISNGRVRTFFVKTWKSRHPCFWNSIVNDVEQCLVRERLYLSSADNVRCMFTTESVESMANRA